MTERQAVADAAQLLRTHANLHFDANGPRDPRGVALWDAATLIDPDQIDALGIGREAADRELQARRALVSTEEAMSAYHDDAEFHRLIRTLSRYIPVLIDAMVADAQQRIEAHRQMRSHLLNGGIIPEGSAGRLIGDDDGRT